jgi:alpha-beta hydrolase superfamily lysophospholipase
MTKTATPVVFIRGLWLHASSSDSWLEALRTAGYEPMAPGWPGIPDTVQQARANPDSIADHGIDDAEANFSPHSPAQVNTRNSDRGPLLLMMGGKDHTVPEAVTKSTAKQYRHSDAETDVVEFSDRGHSLTLDDSWNEVAGRCLSWLGEHGL